LFNVSPLGGAGVYPVSDQFFPLAVNIRHSREQLAAEPTIALITSGEETFEHSTKRLIGLEWHD